jgi:hypothetical protein
MTEATRMYKPIIFLAGFFACYFFLVFPLSTYSRDAKIADIVVTTSGENVVVYARGINCFTKKMESAILAGVPTTFTFLLDVYQERKNWFDEKISSVVVKQTIKYDNVKKYFSLSSTGSQKESEFQEFDEAKKAMSELDGITVASVKDLQKDQSYYVRIKVKLDTIRLPMHMEYILFFVSLWDFETDWHRQSIS